MSTYPLDLDYDFSGAEKALMQCETLVTRMIVVAEAQQEIISFLRKENADLNAEVASLNAQLDDAAGYYPYA